MAGQRAVSNDIFKEEINHILRLFRENREYSSGIIDSKGDIKSVLDFFILHQNNSVFDEARSFFETHFKNEKEVFFDYQKWYVTIRMLSLFVNKEKELRFINDQDNTRDNEKKKTIELKDANSSRYKHFSAWINDKTDVLIKDIVEFIEQLEKSDLQHEFYIDNMKHLQGFNEVDRTSFVDDIAKLIVHHLVSNFDLYFNFDDIPNLNVKEFSIELQKFMKENDDIDLTEKTFFEHIFEKSKEVYLGIKTDISFIQYKIIWDKLDIIRKFLNEKLSYSEKLKNEHAKQISDKNEEMQKKIDELTKINEKDKKKIAELETKIQKLEKEIEELKEKSVNDEGKIAELNMQIDLLQQMLTNLKRSVEVTKRMNNSGLHFDKITDDSLGAEEQKGEGDLQEHKEQDGEKQQQEFMEDLEMKLLQETNKINNKDNEKNIDISNIKTYGFDVIYASALKSRTIYIINGKGYYKNDNVLDRITHIEGGFLRDIKVLRIYYLWNSDHETLNNRIYFFDYRINKLAFCCPDNIFRYFNDRNEFVKIPDTSELKLFMNIETKEIYTMNKNSTSLINPHNPSTPVENDSLIINEKNILFYTHENNVIEVNIRDINAEKFVTKSKKEIDIIKKQSKKRDQHLMRYFILQGFVFTHMNVSDKIVQLIHYFGIETYDIYPNIPLYFTQCFADGNLYIILEFDTFRQLMQQTYKVMLIVNEVLWCEFKGEVYNVQQDNDGLFLYLGKNNSYHLPEKMYVYAIESTKTKLLSRKKSYRSLDLNVQDLIALTPKKTTSPQRRSSYDKSEPDEINNSRTQFSPKQSLKRQRLFASTANLQSSVANLPLINESDSLGTQRSALTTPRSSRTQTPLTPNSSPDLFFKANEFSSPDSSKQNDHSPYSVNGYQTAENETSSPRRLQHDQMKVESA